MAFFMDVSDMIDDFGDDIKVWKPDDQVSQAYPGGQTTDIDLSEEKAEPRHEPVMPVNPNSEPSRKVPPLIRSATRLTMLIFCALKVPSIVHALVNVPFMPFCENEMPALFSIMQ